MVTPAIVINDNVKLAGRVTTINEIKDWLSKSNINLEGGK